MLANLDIIEAQVLRRMLERHGAGGILDSLSDLCEETAMAQSKHGRAYEEERWRDRSRRLSRLADDPLFADPI